MMVRIESVYIPSDEIVAREIDGELLIVPLAAGIGDLEDELYSLNETGRAVWQRLDGSRSLAEIVMELAREYEAPVGEVEQDVRGLLEALLNRKMVTEVV